MRKNCSGFSMIEVVVGMLIFGVMFLAIIKTMQSHAVTTRRSTEMTIASSLAEDIAATIKALPYDQVFSYDSRNKSPVVPDPNSQASADSFYSDYVSKGNFLIPNAISPIKGALDSIETKVKSAGFDSYKLEIIYLVRDNSNISGAVSVDDYITWGSWGVVWNGANNSVCSRLDPNLCFRSLNLPGDRDFFDVVGKDAEVPNTGLKRLTVSVFKKGNVLGVKTGTILTKERFSGNEISDSMSSIVMGITIPRQDARLIQVTPATKASLELKTRRTYDIRTWDGFNVWPYPLRVDNNTDDITVNIQIDILGVDVPAPAKQVTLGGSGKNLLKIVGITNRAQAGILELCSEIPGVKSCWSFSPDESVPFTPLGTDITIWDSFPNFTNFSSRLMQGGQNGEHRIFSRKKAVNYVGSPYSPLGLKRVWIDKGVPEEVMHSSPGDSSTPPVYCYGGQTPYLSFIVGDDVPAYRPTRPDCCSTDIAAAVITNKVTGVPFQLFFPGNTSSPDFNMSVETNVNSSSQTYVLMDRDFFPPKLDPATKYEITWEFGDLVGYKGSSTYQFFTPDPTADASTPTYTISDTFASNPQPIWPVPGDYFPVRQGMEYSFANLSFTDPESGMDLSSFKLEICRDGVPLDPLNPLANTSADCLTLFSKTEGKRPNASLAWGKYFSYGDQADPGKYFRPLVNQSFTDPGTGNLTGLNFAVGTTWRVRAFFKNWKGDSTTTKDDEWRFKIVP